MCDAMLGPLLQNISIEEMLSRRDEGMKREWKEERKWERESEETIQARPAG